MKEKPAVICLTTEQLKKLFADAYYNAVVAEVDMLQTVALLEPLRQVIANLSPMNAWSMVVLDCSRFDKDPFIKMLVSLRDQYLYVYASSIVEAVNAAFDKDEEAGWQLWLFHYAEAVMVSTADVYDAICVAKINFPAKYLAAKEKYCMLNKYILQSRWVDCYETTCELAGIEWLSPEQRARFLIFSAQIYMYWFPDSHLAKKHIDEAAAILKDSDITDRAYAEYYKRMGKFEEARNHLINAQLKKANELNNLLLSGDISKEQGMPEVAEAKYKEAIARNFLDYEGYSRLVTLYGDPALFPAKKSEIGLLVQKMKALESCYPVTQNLYNINRDAGFAFSSNQDYESSENYYNNAIAMQPANSAAIIDLAYIFAYQEKYVDAEKSFLKVISIDPETFEAYWGLGWLYTRQKDLKKALKYYEECLIVRPSWSGLINNTIGIMYEDSGDLETAKKYHENAVKANPSSAEYLSQLGSVYEQQNDIPNAITAYEKAIALNSTDALTWNKLGNIYFDQNDFQKARDCYEHASTADPNTLVYVKNLGLSYQKLGHWEAVIDTYGKAIQLKGDDAESLNATGIAYYVLKDYDKSVDFYQRAIEASKTVTANKNEYVYWSNIGLAYRDAENFDEAEKAFLQSLSLNPASIDNQNYTGILYYMKKDYAKAIEHYKKALELEPDPQVYENIALAYSDNNDFEAAIENFNEALKRRTSDVTVNYLGNVYFKMGEYAKARHEYETAIDMQPTNAVYLSNAGMGYYFDKLYKDASPWFDKALGCDPGYLPALNYGGNCDLILGEYSKAEVRYRRCIEINPRESFYYSNLGICLLKQKRIEEAELYLHEALEIDGNNTEAISNLGFVAYKKGDMKKTEEYFQRAFPGSAEDPAAYYDFLYPDENKQDFEKKLEEDPEDFAALWQLGTINYLNQNREASKEYFHRALDVIFKNEDTLQASIDRLKAIEKKQRDEAISILADMFEDDQELSSKLVDLESKLG